MHGAEALPRAINSSSVRWTMCMPKSRQNPSVAARSRFSQRRKASSTARPTAGGRGRRRTPGGKRFSGTSSRRRNAVRAGVVMRKLGCR